jgi:hypothetical protein
MKQQIKELIEIKNLDLNDYADSHELNEALDYDGSLHEIVDGNIDVVYYDLRTWAVDNYNYIDQAIDEGLSTDETDFHHSIQLGQFVYFSEQANLAIEEIFNEFNSEVA